MLTAVNFEVRLAASESDENVCDSVCNLSQNKVSFSFSDLTLQYFISIGLDFDGISLYITLPRMYRYSSPGREGYIHFPVVAIFFISSYIIILSLHKLFFIYNFSCLLFVYLLTLYFVHILHVAQLTFGYMCRNTSTFLGVVFGSFYHYVNILTNLLLSLFWFNYFQTLFDPYFISLYNLCYTALPCLAQGMLDQVTKIAQCFVNKFI